MNGMEDPRRFNADWYQAELEGEVRNMAWYLERSKAGDQHAAIRVLQMCAASLTPEALAQNQGAIDPLLAGVLQTMLREVLEHGESSLVRMAKLGPSNRERDRGLAQRNWHVCVQMHREIIEKRLTQKAAAAKVLETAPGLTVDALVKIYGRLKSALAQDYRESQVGNGREPPGPS